MTGYFPRVARGVHSYPVDESVPEQDRLGLGVVGLHEGRTALLAAYRTTHVRPVMGCDLSAETLAEVGHAWKPRSSSSAATWSMACATSAWLPGARDGGSTKP